MILVELFLCVIQQNNLARLTRHSTQLDKATAQTLDLAALAECSPNASRPSPSKAPITPDIEANQEGTIQHETTAKTPWCNFVEFIRVGDFEITRDIGSGN